MRSLRSESVWKPSHLPRQQPVSTVLNMHVMCDVQTVRASSVAHMLANRVNRRGLQCSMYILI